MTEGPFDTRTVACPIHGLRYDPATSHGCIRCRASARPGPSNGSSEAGEGGRARVLGGLAVLAALVLGVGGWLGYERFAAPKPAGPRFTETQLIEEARRVHVVIYSATWCPSCDAAKTFLWQNSVPFEEHDIDKDRDANEHWKALNPERTIPVIDVEGAIVVGADPAPMVRALMTAAERHLSASDPAPARE